MDLQERFAPLMAAALHYAGSSEGLAMPLEEIQKRLFERADEERAMPLLTADGGLPDLSEERLSELEDARFAVYAWADEKLLNAPRPDSGEWMPLSLQCHFFSTTEAGQQFFSRLDTILNSFDTVDDKDEDAPDLAERLEKACTKQTDLSKVDLLHVYALCLLYGFRGRLYGQEELLTRVRKACHMLCKRPKPMPVLQEAPARHSTKPLLSILESAGYVLIPIGVCALFWLYCANILAHIPVKGF